MRTRAIVIVLAAIAVSCGGGPAKPSLNLAGSWTGEWRYVAAGATVVDSLTATLTQSGAEASGTWTAGSGASGQFQRLSAKADTTGTLTITVPVFAGPACTATATVTGTASNTDIELTVAAIPPDGVCQWAADQQISLRKE